MPKTSELRAYYYTPYHLARDLIGTTAPFTVFLMLGAIAFPELRSWLGKVATSLVAVESWVVGLLGIGLYSLIAFTTGATASRLMLTARDAFNRIRFLPGIEYKALYSKSQTSINALHAEVIAKPEDLWVTGEPTTREKVDRLIMHFKHYNLDGYQHLYREYSLASMHRQAACYSLALAVLGFVRREPKIAVIFLGLFVLLLLAIRSQVRAVVKSEYQFIVTSIGLKEKSEA